MDADRRLRCASRGCCRPGTRPAAALSASMITMDRRGSGAGGCALRLETGSCHAGSWGGLSVCGPCARRSARLPPSLEGLADDHAAATAGAWRAEVVRFHRGVVIGRGGGVQGVASNREAGPASGAGKQAVVSDAMEAARQDVQQEAADELVGDERHELLPVGATAAAVCVAEGDAALVEADEAAVRGRHPVRVFRSKVAKAPSSARLTCGAVVMRQLAVAARYNSTV